MQDKLGKTSIAEHERADELVLELYCERIKQTGKSVNKRKLDQQMKGTLYLTAPQAIEMGLADGIITKV
ncbi:MAG: hypothetical protein HZB10_03700 [Candidatus Yonathbacteria bacterium]|nr:hypothetical protein [Candidatus Yonathbacteria bacterium]